MKNHALEGLLRQPVEWWSSILCFGVACVIVFYSKYLCLSSSMIGLLSGGLWILGCYRLSQGYHVFRYQRNLKKLRPYSLSSDELPISRERLFLGKGFKWEAKHAQRLWDLKQPGREHYVRSVSDMGGNPALHGIELYEKDVYIKLSERVGHTMILGTTRVGKTRLLELLIASDIRRHDSAVIVFDPKGDVDLLKRICHEAKQVGREHEVIVFHLGYPGHSARYNPIGNFARMTEVANRVANQLPSHGESAAFKEFAWRFVNIIATALVALGKTPNYKALDRYILKIDPLLLEYCEQWLPTIDVNWRESVEQIAKGIDEKSLSPHLRSRNIFMLGLVNYVDRLGLDNPVYDGLKAIFNYDQTYFQKITASLSPLFSKLTSGNMAQLISPDYTDLEDERLIFDWLQVIRGKKIVYIGLDALSDSTVSSAVGNSMFADLCSTIGQIYKFGVQESMVDQQQKKTFYKINVYSDEFNELAGDEFIPLVNKGGGAGLQLTVATQTASDVLARLGSVAKANQVFGNFNTLICLRVLEESTARLLIDKLPQWVKIKEAIQASSAHDAVNANDEIRFSSHTEDRIATTEVPLIATDDLMQLPKGQAFCLLDGGQLYKVRFPLPKNDMATMPDSVEAIVSEINR